MKWKMILGGHKIEKFREKGHDISYNAEELVSIYNGGKRE